MYDIEREAKSLAPDERRVRRQQRSLPVLAEFRPWLEAIEVNVLPKSPLGQAIGYQAIRQGFVVQ